MKTGSCEDTVDTHSLSKAVLHFWTVERLRIDRHSMSTLLFFLSNASHFSPKRGKARLFKIILKHKSNTREGARQRFDLSLIS